MNKKASNIAVNITAATDNILSEPKTRKTIVIGGNMAGKGAVPVGLLVALFNPFLGGAIVLGGAGAWIATKNKARKYEEEAAAIKQIKQEEERQRGRDRLTREQERFKELQNKIQTSSTSRIHGMKIARQVRVVSVDDCATKYQAELRFLEEIEASGSNGVINMKLRRHRRGYSVSGDAVILE